MSGQPDTPDLALQQSSLPKIAAVSCAAPAFVRTTPRVIYVREGCA